MNSPDAIPPPRPPSAEGFPALEDIARRHLQTARRTARKPAWKSPWAFAAVAVVAVAAGALVALARRGPAPPTLLPSGNQTVQELGLLEFSAAADVPSEGQWQFVLEGAPPGARLNARTGKFSWQPSEAQGPGWYDMTIKVLGPGSQEPVASRPLAVAVTEVNQPPVLAPIEDRSVEAGGLLAFAAAAEDRDVPAQPIAYELGPGAPGGAEINARTGEIRFSTRQASPGQEYRITVLARETAPGGLSAERSFLVRIAPKAEPEQMSTQAEKPPAPAEPKAPAPAPPAAKPEPAVAAKSAPEEKSDAEILDLHQKHKLFRIAEYPTLRRIFAARFEKQHEAEIRQAFGPDFEEMSRWLDAHPEFKEELYTAIKPDADNVPAALALLNDLRKAFPDQLDSYANLAIATVVTWDNAESGVYDYKGQAIRTRSTMPEGALNAIENFRYLVNAEKYMQGRTHFLPWEFLVHIVNHKTPQDERVWAIRNYLPKRVMIGKCYADVPYDTEMLNTGGQKTKIGGHPYTLASLAQFGGVCSMQADFAARVAKSIGVPAESVGGESRFGEEHAWVMWVELKGVSKTSIAFSLESFGRYRGDNYYVGKLKDPQTGQEITDRQLELRLHTVGMNPQAKRHADRIMAAYPMLREKEQMDVAGQLMFLNLVIELSAGNEEAWKALAKMSREGVVTNKHNKAMMTTLDNLFRTFAAFPDFTWEVFDDLVAFQDIPQQRAKLYGQLIRLYEQDHRPDLACEARLKYTDYLVEEKHLDQALEGLAYAIRQFPDEGRYVPRMLDKVDEICGKVEGAEQMTVRFYRDVLPMVPQKRGDRPSPYCIEIYERGIERFRKAGQEPLARLYEAKVAALKKGPGGG